MFRLVPQSVIGLSPGPGDLVGGGGGRDSSMQPESGCRPPAEVSTVQVLVDLALPRFVELGDGPRQVHPPWSIVSDSPASSATCRLDTSGEEDSSGPDVSVIGVSQPGYVVVVVG